MGDNGAMKRFFLLAAALLLLLPGTALAQAARGEEMLEAVERHVLQELGDTPGVTRVRAGPLDPRLKLPACDAYQPFTPGNMRLAGNVNIGVRCLGPSRWSIFVPVRIQIESLYVATAAALVAGKTIESRDLVLLKGDLGTLPAGILTDPEAAIGKNLRIALAAGQPVRPEHLTRPKVVRQGQTVRLVTHGPGFAASNEGQALNGAVAGEVVQVRTSSGMVVRGIAAADGTVQVGDAP
jgi:flagella basal body P-ring formation protein FlgA